MTQISDSVQALLVLVPLAIVGVPWLYQHWEVALLVMGTVLLSPFGTVISELFTQNQPINSGREAPWSGQVCFFASKFISQALCCLLL